jgi:K(+)-stimulated pyrophosphate-energized sodium pump
VNLIWVVPVSGLLAVIVAAFLAWDVMRRDTGPKVMQDVADTIYEGAMAFLNRQYRTIYLLAAVAAVVIALLLAMLSHSGDPISVAGTRRWRSSSARSARVSPG